mmetsp:Transcript_71222/g.197806  ORF Transcript_71222/g.197806 Transcript_71222/m.197806 type:complete len:83 (+) Transcript_71222:96-344(+)
MNPVPLRLMTNLLTIVAAKKLKIAHLLRDYLVGFLLVDMNLMILFKEIDIYLKDMLEYLTNPKKITINQAKLLLEHYVKDGW